MPRSVAVTPSRPPDLGPPLSTAALPPAWGQGRFGALLANSLHLFFLCSPSGLNSMQISRATVGTGVTEGTPGQVAAPP